MKANKNNRSVQRTKQLLKSSLIELLQTTSITKISVTKLTKLANINRGTFYLHYDDIYCLLDDLENDMIQDVISILHDHPPVNSEFTIFLLLYNVFEYIQKNSDICKTLLQTDNHNTFLQKMKNVVQEECFSAWDILFHQQSKSFYPAYYAFIVSGCIGLIEYWFEQGMQETPAEMAQIAETIILNGQQILQ
ncbi:MAG: TetR/AcrR family transcriptional regulator [Firmicutes bacterium]|uniref:TetR/AcrR family transcriptional regulator n=1 Tax=Candidatus Scybalomonas excrementavium TaxID=2840943 RepID=A0A9D9N864_9FIRM|nr:TetR/AcrR family transcriptional regulator [Candidatus Scybalomonas excrementavium]